MRSNDKRRYDLILEGPDGEILETVGDTRTDADSDVTENLASLQSQTLGNKGVWLIRARQGHSMKVHQLITDQDMKLTQCYIECPAGVEVHSFSR